MRNAAYYRQEAEALRQLAETTTDEDLALVYRLRAVEYDHLADQAESGSQVQQHGTQPPPPQPGDQPAQQQQQAQPKKED
jgi:hypothetical protein